MSLLIPWGISVREAKLIIADLRRLLEQRRTKEISRSKFLQDYSNLRRELELTPEYAKFHSAVRFRSGGVCESETCTNPAVHVHHRVPVSRAPHLALDVNLAKDLCLECHCKVDASHRRWLKNARSA